MARSMTGYGRGELTRDGNRFTVEMKSVNNRYLDINIRLPRQFNQFESDIRDYLKAHILRGKVDVYIGYEDLNESSAKIRYNRRLAGEYLAQLNAIAQEFGIPNDVSVSKLSSYPDVLVLEEEDEENAEALREPLLETVGAALEQFSAARDREGGNLVQDINAKLDGMQKSISFLTDRAPSIVKAYQDQMYQKIRDMIGDAVVDDSRILQEVAIYSDKVCIDEELVRLKSHIGAVVQTLKEEGSIGRKLDFLAQELNREANTILSKTDDAESADCAIMLKTEIEKIREQIQNVE